VTPVAAKKTPAKKNGGTLIDPRLKRLLAWAFGPGRAVVLAVAMVGGFAAGWYFLWEKFSGEVLSSQEYLVTPERVQISRPPAWIRSDIRAEVFRDASLDGPLSIMDPDLAERIAGAFALHPWVARVVEVRKLAPARVEVDLIYRKPACMVLQAEGQLLPVDVEGVLLPADDFSPVEAVRYPRLEQIDSVPVGPPGTRWGDVGVTGGAQIAAAIGSAWHDLCLDRIVPSKVTGIGYADGPTFELYTLGGSRYLWGRAPGTDVPGEIPAAEKVARLINYKQEYGTLDGINGPQQLDIRSLRSMGTPPQTAGRPESGPR
jgi:hypothetical protein